MFARQIITPICATSIHERRRPNSLSRTGNPTRSTIGAHIHLKEYMSPTQASMPIVARSMCAVRSHADNVENTR
jgi:hypothetical protein